MCVCMKERETNYSGSFLYNDQKGTFEICFVVTGVHFTKEIELI